jgi:predicted dienelactone hydrolase
MSGQHEKAKVFWFFFSKKNIFLLSLLVFSGSVSSAAPSVGFQTALVPDAPDAPLFVGIWYPSEAPARPVRIALDTVPVAPDAAPVGTGLKLIVMSHGQGGGFAGHIDTAIALARAGFVVASLTHTGDNFRDGSRVLKIWDRTRQLYVVTDWVLRAWSGHDHLDPAHIGVFGFSAGGFTALVEAGGVPDLSRIAPHCAAHKTEFTCGLIAQAAPDHATLPVAPPGAWVHDARIAAAVIAAPALGFTFGKQGLANVTVPVQLWRAAQDSTLPQPFYAQAVADDLPRPPEYHVVQGAQHLDFLSPCDADKARIVPQLCQSGPDFTRDKFHIQFNRAVINFFATQLFSGAN